MMWKLIKALFRRIKAWYSLRNHIDHLLTKVENEIKNLQAQDRRSMENDLYLHYLNEKREEYRWTLRMMDDLDYKPRHVDEDLL